MTTDDLSGIAQLPSPLLDLRASTEHRPYTLIAFELAVASCTPFVFLCL